MTLTTLRVCSIGQAVIYGVYSNSRCRTCEPPNPCKIKAQAGFIMVFSKVMATVFLREVYDAGDDSIQIMLA